VDKDALSKVISSEIKNIEKNPVLLLTFKMEDYHTATAEIAKALIKENKMKGIYIALNAPSSTIAERLEKNKVNTCSIHFIDASGKRSKKVEGVDFIASPKSLTGLSIAIVKAVGTAKYDFIYLDSVSTMLLYNNQELTEKFLHYFVNRINSLGLKGILIGVQDERTQKLAPVMAQFCNRCLNL